MNLINFSYLNLLFGAGLFSVLESATILNTESDAKKWLTTYNDEAGKYIYDATEAEWNYNTNLTDHNLGISIKKSNDLATFTEQKAIEANKKFVWKNFTDPLLKREFSKITDIGTASLSDEDFQKMSGLNSDLTKIYSTAKVCNKPNDPSGKCYPLDPDLSDIISKSNDLEELTWAWKGWRDASGKHMPDKYDEFVQLLNKAANINGYEDNGDYWRSWYESPTFRKDCEDLWQEIKPFYEQLHAYVRRKLQKKYPQIAFPKEGHIPAHLLGNMWAQSWENIEYLLRPAPDLPSMDITEELVKQNYTALKLFQLSDTFFKSLGLIQMPQPFWEKSMIEKPADRDVVCHASAWDFYNRKDFRIKQCTVVDMHWFMTTHHEMGHIEYYLHYKDQPISFRSGANPGFHEAIADIASLSVATPEYMQSVSLLPNFTDDPNGDLNFLMNQALTKVAFLPFGYLIDQWRWDVFSGDTPRPKYNSKWWHNRCKYQGVYPPVIRSEQDFDAGSKFHVPNNTPYIRYFVAHIIQFQFHEALCKAANNSRPLHRCNIANSKEAGKKLAELMKSGSSIPWPKVLENLTGSEKMSAKSLMAYYKPLIDWPEKRKPRAENWMGGKMSSWIV
uniref:Angiotensin-converting enzyme n=1 Tax=Theromyzon tessulatum TaxID=13286 RepID=ACE_THETS|nr:RecName: Full=Angiotensin-converting enzyme; AltName: Full=Dipeptidyl carboxypeptidase I; AltName: Full=Kininase II; AltName: Full=TtACE; Flags: Precursor [Theromyzon tessulatum]AAS57725.1 angiotensin-converting enzyme [Theromyzon tessulatum]